MALTAEAIAARRDHIAVAVLAIADGISEEAQLQDAAEKHAADPAFSAHSGIVGVGLTCRS